MSTLSFVTLTRFWRLYRGFALSVALLVFTAIGTFAGLLPVIRSSLNMFSAVQKFEERTKALTEKLQFLDSLDEETIRQNLQTLFSAVPPEKSIPTILSTTDGVIATSALSTLDISISNPGSLATEAATRKTTEEKQIGGLLQPFGVSLEGPVDNFGTFFQTISSVRRLLRVRNFEATISRGNIVQAHVELDAFYSPLPKAIGSIDQPISKTTSDEDAVVAKVSSYPLAAQSLSLSPQVSTGRTNPFGP